MTRPVRSSLSARDIPDMHAWLTSRTESMILSTQPEVAGRVLELLDTPQPGVHDLSDVIRTDPVLSGRVLKLANSALYAQRRSISDVEHACILLGTERLSHVVLGFQVATEAHALGDSFSRRVWSLCLARAFLAGKLASRVSTSLARPAFVVGLMVDAGVSLMPALVGEGYEAKFLNHTHPDLAYRTEFETLPFTHVDVAEVLAKRWHLPDTLRKPIAWHHTRPAGRRRVDQDTVLHRVAYCVGQLRSPLDPDERDHVAHLGDRCLGMTAAAVREVCEQAAAELHTVRGMLADSAARFGDMADLNRIIHAKLVEAHGDAIVRSLVSDLKVGTGAFFVAGRRITVEPDTACTAADRMVAYLHDDRGDRVLSHRFRIGEEDARALCDAFVITPESDDDTIDLDAFLRDAATTAPTPSNHIPGRMSSRTAA